MTVNLCFRRKAGNRVFPKPSLPTEAEFYILPYLEVMAIEILTVVLLELTV